MREITDGWWWVRQKGTTLNEIVWVKGIWTCEIGYSKKLTTSYQKFYDFLYPVNPDPLPPYQEEPKPGTKNNIILDSRKAQAKPPFKS